MSLPKHPWDDAIHRDAIHAAFDKWFIAYEAHNMVQAHRYKMVLVRLTNEAKLRHCSVLTRQAILSGIAEIEAAEVV